MRLAISKDDPKRIDSNPKVSCAVKSFTKTGEWSYAVVSIFLE
jgi:hypothetical protein